MPTQYQQPPITKNETAENPLKKRWATEIPVENNYASISQKNLEKKVEKLQNVEEEQYMENTNIRIDTAKFNQILDNLIQYLNESQKTTISTLLSTKSYRLEYNKWIFSIPSDIHKQLLEKEKDLIISYIRKQMGMNEIYLQLVVDTNLHVIERKPYTNVEKAREMASKNPLLVQLQEMFKTRIID
ncbi:MAG: hypothetical protein ACKVTZ_10430 [Bacteroidia bacterium]